LPKSYCRSVKALGGASHVQFQDSAFNRFAGWTSRTFLWWNKQRWWKHA